MQTFWFLLLIFALGSFVAGLRRARGYYQRGETLPPFLTGSVSNAAAFSLLITFNLLSGRGPLAWAALTASICLFVVAARQFWRARSESRG